MEGIAANEAKFLVYIAGYPDLFPMEYYDYSSKQYLGAIPTMLRQFSNDSTYEIVYVQSYGEDQREHLRDQLQLDMITVAQVLKEDEPPLENQVLLFQSKVNGIVTNYYLEISPVAPVSLKNDLIKFVEATSQEELTGIILQAQQYPMNQKVQQLTSYLFVLTVVLFILLTSYLVIFQKYRKQKTIAIETRKLDVLTGTGNLDFLAQTYETKLQEPQRILYSLFSFYLDGSRIERLGGREAIQEVLCFTASLLEKHANTDDYVARVNDQSFAVLRNTGDHIETEKWLTPIFKELQNFVENRYTAESSIVAVGIYPLTTLHQPLNDLLYFAGRSAEMAYEQGEQMKFCDEKMQNTIIEERELQADISRALHNKEFELYVQFYVDTQSGMTVGGEALIRWEHPEKGFLLPNRFVPLMEKEGYIDQIDYSILEKSCQFLEELQMNGDTDFFLSCNISRKTFSSQDFVQKSLEIVERYNFDKRALIFEMTESVSISNFTRMLENAQAIKKSKIRIALDDFGEKLTSFFDLQEYPVDLIKLDKHLIDKINTQKGRAILKGMIQVVHDVGLIILAEGVEDEEQLQALKEIGCDLIQGFHFHYPIPAWAAMKKLLS